MSSPISGSSDPFAEMEFLLESSQVQQSDDDDTDSMDSLDPSSIAYDPSLDPSNPLYKGNVGNPSPTNGVPPPSNMDASTSSQTNMRNLRNMAGQRRI